MKDNCHLALLLFNKCHMREMRLNMKILEFKGKMSLKNKILLICASVFLVLFLGTFIIYISSSTARDWININILRKELTEEETATIDLDVDKQQNIYAYDRFISILYNGKLSIYNSYASKEAELDVGISNPVYDTSQNYLGIAESNGQRICLISDTRTLWTNKVEGNIVKISVNRNGYLSAIVSGTGYKSVIVTFDKNGKELFKTYLASSIAVDSDISVDGKRLAIAEVVTTGTLIESKIRIIDMEKAIKGEGEASAVFRHTAEAGKMITNIKYQEKGQLVCMYDNSIHMIYNDKDNLFLEFNSDTKIADINLKSSTLIASEKFGGLFNTETKIAIKNILTGDEAIYTVDSSVKEAVCYDQIIAVNLGTEINFINLNRLA